MESSAWRLGDAAAYADAMMLADALCAELARIGRDELGGSAARLEAVRLRAMLGSVDGFDRAAVEGLVEQLERRLLTLREAS